MREIDANIVTETLSGLLQDVCYRLPADAIEALRRASERNDMYGGDLYEEGKARYKIADPGKAAVH